MNIEKEKETLEEITNIKQEKERELKQSLLVLRNKLLKSIENYNDKINQKEKELLEVNKQICEIFGHDFTMWEEKADKYLDRSWYYTRECKICSKQEQIDSIYGEPDEYFTKDHKGKIHIHTNR